MYREKNALKENYAHVKQRFFFGNLLSICTKVMGPPPTLWNINSKVLDEITKKLQIKKILDEITRLWMKIE